MLIAVVAQAVVHKEGTMLVPTTVVILVLARMGGKGLVLKMAMTAALVLWEER